MAQCHECGRRSGPDWFLVCLRPPKGRGTENIEEWLCGRPKCYASYNEEVDSVPTGKVLEVVNGIEVRAKVKDPTRLQPGQYVRNGRSVVVVESVNDAGAKVRVVAGRGAGTTTTWSASTAGHTFLTKEQVEAEVRQAAAERAASQDESVCANCWPGYVQNDDSPGTLDSPSREDMGRDPNCPKHIVSEAAVEAAVPVRRAKVAEKPEDVKRVLELRATGMAYHKIEKEMGWPDTKGGRTYKIVKAAEKPKERAPGLRPTPRGRK